MQEFTVHQGTTLKKFTDETCAQASFCLRTLLKEREVRVNGIRTGEDLLLHPGDVVRYYMTPAQEQKKAFEMVYEDENVAVVDKESGVSCEAVLAALRERGARAVHRLDRNTEGIMIFAKNGQTEEELLSCFRERRVKKEYLALVKGSMPKKSSTERAYLLKDPHAALVKVAREPIGEEIVTEYQVMEQREETSLLRVILHTGKTHQIRAHLSYLGHPVVGDEKYGDTAFNKKMHAARQRLVSKSLTLDCGAPIEYLRGKTFVSEKNL